MKTSSAKAKGRKLQQDVRDALIMAFPSLNLDDVRSTAMGSNGSDILLSSAAKVLIPYAFECKARETTKTLYDWLDQAKSGGTGEPVVVFRANRKRAVAMLHFDHFMELIKNAKAT